MTTVACPQCGNKTIVVDTWVDSEGDAPYVRVFTDGEIDAKFCACNLTQEEEQEAVQQGIQAAEDGAGDDWIERE